MRRTFLHVLVLALCCCLTAAYAAQDGRRGQGATVGQAAYSGNVKTRKYHNSGCRYFACKNCVARFSSAAEARAKGFQPCKICEK